MKSRAELLLLFAACAHSAALHELRIEGAGAPKKLLIAEGPAEVVEVTCTAPNAFIFLGLDGNCDQPDVSKQPAELHPSRSYGLPFVIPEGKVGCVGLEEGMCTVRWK